MKKFTTELSDDQGVVYRYLIKDVGTGLSLVETLQMIEEQYECITEHVSDCFARLTSIEKVEVIHFVTKNILRKHG